MRRSRALRATERSLRKPAPDASFAGPSTAISKTNAGACVRRNAKFIRGRGRRWGLRAVVLLAILCVSGFTSRSASALPLFARRTGMACTACHEAWPRLTDFGELYRDNGYQ